MRPAAHGPSTRRYFGSELVSVCGFCNPLSRNPLLSSKAVLGAAKMRSQSRCRVVARPTVSGKVSAADRRASRASNGGNYPAWPFTGAAFVRFSTRRSRRRRREGSQPRGGGGVAKEAHDLIIIPRGEPTMRAAGSEGAGETRRGARSYPGRTALLHTSHSGRFAYVTTTAPPSGASSRPNGTSAAAPGAG